MFIKILLVIFGLVVIFATGCATETLPPLDEAGESTVISEQSGEIATSTVQPLDSYPAGEVIGSTRTPEAYPMAEATDMAQGEEAYPADEEQESMEEKPTNTPEKEIAEENLQLQPTSPKKYPQRIKNINLAKADLADRMGLKLPSTEIEVVGFEEVIWSDSSLGCPEPDMMYTQTIIDGYVIQLQIGDETFNYHGANGEDPFLCLNAPDANSEIEESAEESMANSQSQRRIDHAKNDLAERLEINLEAIELISNEQVTWNDGSLGCPQPDMMYTQALIDGYQIQLQVGGQVYNYHGANGEDPFLCEN
jgi:hypothetical protein